jgi:hypothetical protein
LLAFLRNRELLGASTLPPAKFTSDEGQQGLESLLATDVRFISDGGGEFRAALKPIRGRDKVVRFYMKTLEHRRPVARMTMRMLNGLPALLIEYADHQERQASQLVQSVDIGPDGRIHTLHAVLASRKLTAVRFLSRDGDGTLFDGPV